MPEIVEIECDLSKETTFRVGGIAKSAYIPESLDEFCQILRKSPQIMVVGAGSNLIASSESVETPLVLTKKLNKFRIEGTILTAECGVKTALISQKACEAGLSGFEFLTCIPASIGGVVYMNASAHKQSISDVIVEAKVFDLANGKVLTLSKDELALTYRTSVLQRKDYVLLEATFELQKAEIADIKARMDANKSYRNQRHPSMKTPNAGSTFRNPEGAIAGQLIEQAGLKGQSVGGAMVSEIHANFIVNYNNATSLDILTLMSRVQDEIEKKYGYKLKPEVKYIGNSEKEEEIWQKLNN